MSLTPDQARALWDAGGFALLEGLPAGSDAGIDGTINSIKSFAGYKFVPPGFHLLVWSTNSESIDEVVSPGAAALAAPNATSLGFPLRVSLPHHYAPKERTRVTYDGKTESAKLGTVDEAALPGLDPQLAAYPFPQLEGWKALTGAISSAVVKRVLGELEVVDSLTGEAGGDEIGALREALGAQRNKAAEAAEKDKGAADKATTASATTATSTSTSTETKSEAKVETKTKDTAADSEKHVLQYPVFDLKRSWPADARGDELSRWSRDKSALLAKVCKDVGGPAALLGHLQLSFALTTNVWNFASLGAYKRIVSLFTQSPAAMAGTCPAEFDFGAGGSHAALQKIYLALLGTMTAQLKSLPPTAFDTELPDLDTFYLAQLDHLRQGLGAALAEKSWWGLASRVASDWAALQKVGKERGWAIEDMRMGDEDSDAEEGEYAPMVVEM